MKRDLVAMSFNVATMAILVLTAVFHASNAGWFSQTTPPMEDQYKITTAQFNPPVVNPQHQKLMTAQQEIQQAHQQYAQQVQQAQKQLQERLQQIQQRIQSGQ